MKTSQNDSKTYHTDTLKNGLRLVYIEDSQATKSACSLVVNTGSFDDPDDRPGFAHFIEHLLFNGNKKYPNNNALGDSIAKHGGHCNAWTATEHSCFHFDVNNGHFIPAIDSFANMFIEPLFSEEAIQSEQEAIHAEYKLKLRDDSRRIQQVHKETCNPAHPFRKFSVGNRQTLSDLPERPVREEVLAFWDKHYQAQFMTVCLVSPNDKALEVAKEVFGQIKTANALQTKPVIKAPLYTKKNLASFICIRPVKELHKLNLTFALPSIDHLYQHKMVSFIAHLLGHEGTGSLYENLKNQGLINALSAGNGISGQNFKDFNISIELTELGESRLDIIMTQVFSYINFMKSELPPEYLYEEQKRLSLISFNFQESIKPIKVANQIALNMHHYDTEDYIFGDYRMDGFELAHWNQIFSFFEPNNLRVTLVSQNISTNQEAHWYHTPYSIQPIDPSVLEELASIESNTGVFAYPSPNPYLENEIKNEDIDFKSSTPLCLEQSKGWQAWFKQDLKYRVPKGNIYIAFDLPNGINSVENQAFLRLFCELFMDDVANTHYQAETAGLHYNLYAHTAGLTLYTSGFSANQPGLLEHLIAHLFELKPTRSRFEEVKRQLIKHWKNSESSKPISQLFSLLNAHLIPSAASSLELAKALEHVNVEQFNNFTNVLFEKAYVESLIYGNWNTAQATSINEKVKSQLKHCQAIDDIPREILEIKGDGILELSKKIDHQDSASLLYLQGFNGLTTPQDEIEKALFILASQILAPFVFNRLRTEKQLGYLVGSGYMPLCNVPGLAVYVQSHDFDSEQLTSELYSCLTDFAVELANMNQDDFEKHKRAVCIQYNEKPTNMSQQSQQLWVAISNQDYLFDQKEKIVLELEQLTLQQLSNWYHGLFDPLLNKGVLVNSR